MPGNRIFFVDAKYGIHYTRLRCTCGWSSTELLWDRNTPYDINKLAYRHMIFEHHPSLWKGKSLA